MKPPRKGGLQRRWEVLANQGAQLFKKSLPKGRRRLNQYTAIWALFERGNP